jgi:hypothetical protein
MTSTNSITRHLNRALCTVSLLGALSSSASALTLTMTASPYGNGNGLHGGEYTATSATLSNAGYSPLVTAGLATGAIQTFCLEYGEHFSFGSSYSYSIGTAATLGSGGAVNGADPISNGTAWLYSQFATGTLANYNYSGAGRAASASELQLAFWFLEDETPLISGYGSYNPNSNIFLSAAISQFGSVANAKADASNLFGVSVLNLTTGNTHNQSQLYYSGGGNIPSTPDSGSTLVLAGFTALGLMAARCRISRNTK